jgi:hypothetical protein
LQTVSLYIGLYACSPVCDCAAEAGKSFGELALITDDAVRSASVIADDVTDLMIIKKQLFDDTLKVRNLGLLIIPLFTAHSFTSLVENDFL